MDPLEETQEIAALWGGYPEGVYRIIPGDDDMPRGALHTMQRASELSTRYEVPRINMTARQAK